VVGTGSGVPVPSQQGGPTLWVFAGGASNYWAFGSNPASGGPYHAVNPVPALNTWYAIQMIVNPATDLATIYVQNLTAGDPGWTLLQFDSQSMPGANLSSVPAGLLAGEESPSLYNGFQISGSPGAQFDAIGAQLYYPSSPRSSYVPSGGQAPGGPPSNGSGDGGADGPLPLWAIGALGAGLFGVAARRLRTHSNLGSG